MRSSSLTAGPQYYIGVVPYCSVLPHKLEFEPGELCMGQAPGTHWDHARKHGSTAIDVMNGMTGAFIIEGQYDDDLNAFYASYGVKRGEAKTESRTRQHSLRARARRREPPAGRTRRNPGLP